MYLGIYQSPVGELAIVTDDNNLLGLWLIGQKYFMKGFSEDILRNDNSPIFVQTKSWLDRYFAGQQPTSDELPLSPIGGEFRQVVWKILRKIPYGQVMTYGDIAQKIAAQTGKTKMSAQAIGGAVGHNPISIIIPCHRVIGKNGNLTGYAGGLEAKQKLLEFENGKMKYYFE